MTETAIGPMRACTKCGVEKPLNDEHFASRPSAATGFRAQCRPCLNAKKASAWKRRQLIDPTAHRERVARWRRSNPERQKEINRAGRTPEKRRRDRENRKAWWASLTPDQKAEQAAKLRAWTAENRERSRELARNFLERETAEQRERRLEKVRARRPIYERENPEVIAAKRARRRAREYGADGSYSAEDVRAILKSQGRRCRYCNEALTRFHVDHFIPLSRGGSNWPSNLVLSCGRCNSSKGSKMPWVWRPDLFSPPSE